MISPALLLLLSAATAAPARPDHIYLLVVDGARSTEMTEAGFPYTPNLGETYAPRGSLVEMLENRDSTYTDAAHRQITTSRRQPTSGVPWDDNHEMAGAMHPTIFEEYTRQLGLGPDAAFVIGNSVFMDNQGNSIYPGMQGHDAPELADHEIQDHEDDYVLDALIDRMTKNPQIKLVMWNIHEADKDGHDGDWDAYVSSLTDADTVIDRLVREHASSRDAFFVFADHGRHDGLTNWANHGDECGGCRPSFLVAWGPGIRQGVEIAADYELNDLAATVAWVAGVEMKASRGRPIVELLEAPPEEPDEEHSLADPDVLVDADGTAHLVAQRLPWAADDGAILYRRGTGSPTTWGEWTAIPTARGAITPEDPRLHETPAGVVLTFRAYDPFTRFWAVYATLSADGGASWETPEVVDAGVFHFNAPQMVVDPADGALHGMWWSSTTPKTDEPAAFTWATDRDGGWSVLDSTVTEDIHLPLECQVAFARGEPVAVCAGIMDIDYPQGEPGDLGEKGSGDVENREVAVVRGFTDGAEPTVEQITDTDGPSFWPSLTSDGEVLHLAWAERSEPLLTGGWSVWYATSDDGGDTWSAAVQIDDGGAEAWRPSVVLTTAGPVVAYTEIDGDTHRAMVARLEGGAVDWRQTVAEEDAVIDRVALAEDGARLLVTWNLSRGFTDDTVEVAEVALDGGGSDTGETGETGGDNGGDSGETGTDNGGDSGDSGGDNAGDTGGKDAPGTRTCCGVTDRRSSLAWTVAALGLAVLRRRRGPA